MTMNAHEMLNELQFLLLCLSTEQRAWLSARTDFDQRVTNLFHCESESLIAHVIALVTCAIDGNHL